MMGPGGEYLFTSRGKGTAKRPVDIICNTPSGEHDLLDGPTHHGSVMFRKSAYKRAGGYRSAFYYGQDWDLWYRLATCGKFGMIEKPLLRAALSPTSISFLKRAQQQKYAALSFQSFQLRMSGLTDDKPLREAEKLKSSKESDSISALRSKGYYFVGRCLQKNRDHRSAAYLINAIKEDPLFFRAWLFTALSLARRSWDRSRVE
jgi:hypothetical protein